MRYAFRSALAAVLIMSVAACANDKNNAATSSGNPPIGVDLPRADSDFWNSYAKYVPKFATELGVNMMPWSARAPRRS